MTYRIEPELSDGEKLNGTYWRLYTAVYGQEPANGAPVVFEHILADVESELAALFEARRVLR